MTVVIRFQLMGGCEEVLTPRAPLASQSDFRVCSSLNWDFLNQSPCVGCYHGAECAVGLLLPSSESESTLRFGFKTSELESRRQAITNMNDRLRERKVDFQDLKDPWPHGWIALLSVAPRS